MAKKRAPKRRAWNKGLEIGKRDGFTPDQVKRIRGLLANRGVPGLRDLALFSTAIDTMLHGQDLLALVVRDVQRRDGSMRPVIEVARARGMPPYFKPSSPERADLVEPNAKARLVEINGQVLTRLCRPVDRALVDLWHADEHGEYDNAGFRYRGHLFTDGEGRYRFRTILPALYPGRTRHYHIKVQAPERPVLTTQLYFPDEPANQRDGLFRRDLAMRIAEAPNSLAARFDFVLDMQ